MNLLDVIYLPLLVLDDDGIVSVLNHRSQVLDEGLEVLVDLQEHLSLPILLQLPLGFPFLHLCL